MIRNLKALGLALVAVFAVGAMSASAASATDLFTVGNGKTSALMTGISHTSKFQITGGPSFSCTTARYAGTAVHKASEATVDAEYTGLVNATPHATPCTTSIANVTATIDMNGCDYDLTGNTNNEDPVGAGKDATVSITCSGANVIKVTSSAGATVSIPAQTPTATGGVHYTNLPNHTGGAAVVIAATVTGITFTCAPALACGLAKIPTHGNDSDYTDSVTVTGYEDTEGLPTPVTEGARVPIEVS